ncbi:MAG TPA: response regulator transcription factor [Acidobacteriaceae bacterium]|nr:response regulator transcription factor [Acidobacteriaceae bacterium]
MDDSGTKRPIRVGLFNFEPLRVAGFSEIFAARGAFEARTVQLPALLHEPEFDLLLIALSDVPLTCELLSSLKSSQPRLRAIVMGAPLDEESVIALIAAGAKGWLEDTSTPEQILQALHIVFRGSIWAPRRVLSNLVDRALGGKPMPLEARRTHFTDRERDVLRQLVMARSNREIAQALSLREQTVKSYIARMMRKVGVDNRIALSMQAAESKSGTPEDR